MNINSTSNSSAASSKGFSGLVSGLDTDTMVESMLSGIQSRINKQKQSQQVLNWQQEKYRDVITKINDFQDKYFSLTSSTSLRLASSFAASKASSSSSAVKILSSDTMNEGSFDVKVDSIATAASVTSSSASKNEISSSAKAEMYSREVTFSYGQGDDKKSVTVDLADFISSDGSKTELSDFVDALNTKLSSEGLNEIGLSVEDGTLSVFSDKEFKISGSLGGLGMLGFGGTVSGSKAKDSDTFEAKTKYANPDVKLNGEVTIALDGKAKTFKLDEGQSLLDIQDKIKAEFGEGIKFEVETELIDGEEVPKNVTLKANGAGRSLTVTGDGEVMKTIGLKSSNSSRISLSSTLADLNGEAASDEKMKLTINGKEIEYSNKESVSQIISKINNSGAGVKMSYNSLSDTFSIENSSLGSDFKLSASDEGGFLEALGFNVGGSDGKTLEGINQGTNAKFSINGNQLERAGNVINYNGVTFELKKQTSESVEITTEKNVDKLYENIKGFVDDYNSLIADLNKITHEEATYKKYPALTDAQKKEMTEKEIELWEEKAKTGLLRNDSDISKFLQDMRAAMYTKGSPTSLVLSNIGIDSSSNYKDYGKLVIDENTLKSALKSNTEAIADMFSNAKTGLATRLNDICKATANTSSGNPGTLVSKAGVVGKASEKDNLIYDKLQQINTKLKSLNTLYDKKKNKYWKMFNSMENTLSKYASQSDYFAQM